MLTGHPLPPDVHTTTGQLGGVPVVFVAVAGTGAGGVILHLHGGGFALGSASSSVGAMIAA